MMFLSILALACSGKTSDDSGDTNTGVAPDVTGAYNVIVSGTNGCEGESSWITGWATGRLDISGDPADLTFDFLDGVVLTGRVTSSNSYTFSGIVDFDNPTTGTSSRIAISNGGVFTTHSSGMWEMTGDFEVEVDRDPAFTSDDCTISGSATGVQFGGAD